MPRFHSISAFLLIAALVVMTGCQTSGSGSRSWNYKPAQRQAQQAPSSLSEGSVEAYPNKSAARSIMTDPETGETRLARAGIEQIPLEEGMPAEEIMEQTAYPALQPTPQSGLPKVKVALLLPLSGEHTHLGKAMLKSAQMALFDVGHSGFELLPRDTKGTATGAKQAARQAIQDGAQLVLGPVFAESVRAAKSVTQRANVNMIGFSTDWSLSGGNTFVMGFLPFDQMERILHYASLQGLSRVGVLVPNTDYGQAVLSAYRSMISTTTMDTVDIKYFEPHSANLSPTIREFAQYDLRIGSTDPVSGQKKKDEAEKEVLPPPFDAVLLPVGGDLVRATANLLSHYDMSPRDVKRLGTGLWDDAGLASEPSLAGGWFAAPSPKGRTTFENRYNQLYKSEPPRLASLAYDATALAAVLAQSGLKQEGRPAFDRTAISNPNGFAGIDGIFRFRSDGIVERGLAVLEFRNGQIEIIDDAPKTFQRQQTSRY